MNRRFLLVLMVLLIVAFVGLVFLSLLATASGPGLLDEGDMTPWAWLPQVCNGRGPTPLPPPP